MNIILGFGETEKRHEETLEKQMRDHVADEFAKESECYFSGEFVKKTKEWASELAKQSQEVADEYRHALDYPSRYSSFYCHTLGDANHIVFIISFHHINRRHALSPDGWGMLASKRVFDVYVLDAERAKKAEVSR